MQVFRLSREKYAEKLSGIGAALKGARWNSPGTEIIYTAANRSLAMAEVAVHFTIATLPSDYSMMTINIPSSVKIKKFNLKNLPRHWNRFPYSTKTQYIGDDFVRENKYAVLKLPSVVTLGDYNYLINPRHPQFTKINITKREQFPFDDRLFLG